MLQPHTPNASSPVSGPSFDCASPFAPVALVQLASGEGVGDRLQRCLARLIERRKAR